MARGYRNISLMCTEFELGSDLEPNRLEISKREKWSQLLKRTRQHYNKAV